MGIEWIILLLLFVEYSIFLPKIFAKAGITETWKGYVPVYNLMVMIKIMKKPWWWILFMLVPGVNLLMLMAMNLELARVFNLYSAGDTLLSIFVPHALLPKIALKKEIVYTGPTDWTNTKHREIRKVSDMIVLALVSVGIFNVAIALYKMVGAKDKPGSKTLVKEWGDALLFAIVAASIIRSFFLEAFKIPTPSMEKNLLVGDFLFVSKMSYGPKLAQTPVAFPFVHHTLPVVETKSYLNIFELPYYRLPGFGSVQRNDVVVFNFPCGDSVQLDRQNETYYQIVRDEAYRMYIGGLGDIRRISPDSLIAGFKPKMAAYMSAYRNSLVEQGKLGVRPVDKEDHYIKRCVAVAGETVEVKNGNLYVNGELSGNTDKMQYNYRIALPDVPETLAEQLKEDYDIYKSDHYQTDQYGGTRRRTDETSTPIVTVSNDKIRAFREQFKTLFVERVNNPKGWSKNVGLYSYLSWFQIFPNHPDYDWSNDNFGPLWVPKKDAKIDLNLKNLPLYERIIGVYEHNKLQVKGNDIYINDQKATSYTFKQDYYWLMGDNRQNSADSRYWGFVPEDHIVGKGVLVWFSSDPEGGVRWNRIFKLIR